MDIWDKLLRFLASRGADTENLALQQKLTPDRGFGLFAIHRIPPHSELLILPPPCITPPLPPPSYSSIKGIYDEAFKEYIALLPESFSYHPLDAFISTKNSLRKKLVSFAPPQIKKALLALETRFREDWNIVQAYLARHPRLKNPEANQDDFLWAWLNGKQHNMDWDRDSIQTERFSQHAMRISPTQDAIEQPRQLFAVSNFGHGKPFKFNSVVIIEIRHRSAIWPHAKWLDDFVSSRKDDIKAGSELFLQYGPHPNSRLFVDYGFVDLNNQSRSEVDITDLLEQILLEDGQDGLYRKELLEAQGYWGDWTLHGGDAPFPSYRLIVALRLYHSQVQGRDNSVEVKAWQGVVLGLQDTVSAANEKTVRESLNQICTGLQRRAERGLELLQQERKKMGDTNSDDENILGCVEHLWREEHDVAVSLSTAIQIGVGW
ncbi:hypothetical protein DL96DRAFT_1703239 [Flagelloscypha sp. PMI_526]|nr:hypothetical protein DL96DRAFT_1703239 [Flagelloscypha sp. PMI_526]